MMNDAAGALNRAMSQRERALQAPAPHRVKVDGRSLAQLLGFAADYGALIQFYDLANQPDGDWSAFFAGDRSIGLALRAALDLADIEAELDILLQALRTAAGGGERGVHWCRLEAVLRRLCRLAGGATAPDSPLERALEDLARPGHALAGPAALLLAHLGTDAGARLVREQAASAWLEQLAGLLEALVAGLMVALARARDDAIAELEASLGDRLHPPQSALWNAFAQLFRHPQRSVNRFAQRFQSFYQRAVLRQTGRAGLADQLYLTFTPAPGAASVRLPKGSAFLAGADADGETVAYALDQALTVDTTAVAGLRTLTRVSAAQAPGAAAQVFCGVAAAPVDAPFPLFGAGHAGQCGALASSPATLGFAVSSPCLLLAGGTRKIKLGLGLDPASVTALESTYGAACASTGTAWAELLARLLEQSFCLSYSSAAGWVDIRSYAVSAPAQGEQHFVLSFQLDPDAAAVSACLAAGPLADAPTLRARLRQEPVWLGQPAQPVYPYAVLSRLALAELRIQANVAGLAELQIDGPQGPVDASAPFAPFGSPPVQYAAVSVSAPELFVKQLYAFSMTIEWAGLPVTTTGFKGYYEGYVVNADGVTVAPGSLFDNDSFTAGLTVRNPGRWDFAPGQPFQPLFQAGGDTQGGALRQHATLRQRPAPSEPPGYYDWTKSAVLLRLETPDYAFGDILYAPNVMAAATRLTAAASACAIQCGKDQHRRGGAALALLDRLGESAITAGDGEFRQRMKAAFEQAVGGLDGAALNAIEHGITTSTASGEQQSAWRASLADALGQGKSRSLLQRVRELGRRNPDYAAVHDRLGQWLGEHAGELDSVAPGLSARAGAPLDAASGALALQSGTAAEPVAAARPMIASGARSLRASLQEALEQTADDCVQKCMDRAGKTAFPNQPWLPMAKSLRVGYGARAALPPPEGAPADAAYAYLCPFDRIEPADWRTGTIPLLAPIADDGALEIELSAPTRTLSLLFSLEPPAGGWPTATPVPAWYQATGPASWRALTPQSDSTDAMRKSGIVRLELDDWPAGAPLRLRLAFASGDAALFPLLAALATNAATASWQGPGDASRLGQPLAAGSVARAADALPGLGKVVQPLPSFGGRPGASGPGFDLWLAERLRHKDYGIQDWDYASLVLAAFPALWQVAVVPASDGSPGQAPGQVWVVPVPGPDTPAIADPSVPSSDRQTLDDIAAFLAERISPFIRLNVTNPPYVRVTVHADLLFTADDAVQACISRLNDELVEFLSPWPPAGTLPRPRDYYTRQEVANFVRHRPYVRGILALSLTLEGSGANAARPYFTSAPSHRLHGKAASAPALVHRPRLALGPDTASTEGETA